VRLPGSGGACEIAILARRVLVVAPQDRRSFPARVDFVTSPGYLGGPGEREALGMPGGGPRAVVTNLGTYTFVDGEMTLASLHPGCSLDDVRANIGWDVRVLEQLDTTAPPTDDELRLLRDELDPNHLYL